MLTSRCQLVFIIDTIKNNMKFEGKQNVCTHVILRDTENSTPNV